MVALRQRFGRGELIYLACLSRGVVSTFTNTVTPHTVGTRVRVSRVRGECGSPLGGARCLETCVQAHRFPRHLSLSLSFLDLYFLIVA